ncbi:WS/DGAT/MGAT family O-acyltransferase [Gordonia rhizosphera]|uniref:Diacylglycerol O-acyltransferase n=1 Tax=Gordonia rhizosphera NBRC 16068 TaxID=1108045 RepID=K6VB30_9ACTN|nr:wax ester/triacylglycerol synthase family O-acyltransferase [Gordonia rhizosphera]GAB93408.1 putative wax ester synthase/diacylglycerol acyltransferase [Gordonia rhizosphera NBRC 16068]
MRRLSSVDAQFLAVEDGRTHSHVCQLTILEGTTVDGTPVDGALIRDHIASRIENLPPFRWRVREVPFGLDYPVFVEDESFDPDSHIWEVALPAPGTPQQLAEAVGQIASRPLDRARPLWEVHLIHGVEGGQVAMLTKLHHSAIDGVSGIQLLSAIIEPTPHRRLREATDADVPRGGAGHDPSDLELLGRAVLSMPMQPVRMIKALPATLRHIDQLPTMRSLPGTGLLSGAADRAARIATRNRDGRTLERPAAAQAPKVSFGGKISPHRRFAYGSLSLPLIKAVKDANPGTTVNDVVVALSAGALRRRMTARGDDLDTALVALVPLSVRTKDSAQPNTYGNQISSLMVAIPTDESDVLARLKRAGEVMRSAKERHRAIPAQLLRDANHTVPPALFARTARVISMTTAAGWINPPFNVTISNVPGSASPLYCAGAPVVSQHPVNVLLDGVGLSLTLLSYGDRLDFGFTADRELVPDVWQLVPEMEAELHELADALGIDA